MKNISYFFVALAIIISTSRHISVVEKALYQWGFWSVAIFIAWKIAINIWRCIPQEKISSDKKAVLITGCDSGFGHDLARRLYDRGYKVYAGCLFQDGDGANQLRNSCPNTSRMHIIQMNVAKSEEIKAAVEYVKDTLDDHVLWAIVNNAGIGTFFQLEWAEISTYRQMYEVNALGTVGVTLGFLPLLRKSKGRIVIVASISGRFTISGFAAYSMSKYAVVSFAEALRREIGQFGIRVTTIEPTLYRTSIMSDSKVTSWRNLVLKYIEENPEIKEAYGESYVQHYLSPMKVINFLASENVYEVIDAMEEAISNKNPQQRYQCHGLLGDFITWVILSTPDVILDVILRTFSLLVVAGHPKGAPQLSLKVPVKILLSLILQAMLILSLTIF